MSDWHTKKKIRKRGGEASRAKAFITKLNKEQQWKTSTVKPVKG